MTKSFTVTLQGEAAEFIQIDDLFEILTSTGYIQNDDDVLQIIGEFKERPKLRKTRLKQLYMCSPEVGPYSMEHLVPCTGWCESCKKKS